MGHPAGVKAPSVLTASLARVNSCPDTRPKGNRRSPFDFDRPPRRTISAQGRLSTPSVRRGGLRSLRMTEEQGSRDRRLAAGGDHLRGVLEAGFGDFGAA